MNNATRNPTLRFKDEDGKYFANWERKTIKELLINYRLGGNYSNSDKVTNRPLLKMGNIGRGNIVVDKIQYIEEKVIIPLSLGR